ncbi:LysR family transcriptional regulator [Enterococcus sp. LJL120]
MMHYLETFRSVYETKSFSLSAEQLFLSQPTVSNQIKALENELGVSLFVRNGRSKIVATPQADLLYQKALEILDQWHSTVQSLQQEKAALTPCNLAVSQTFASYLLPDLLNYLLEKFPNLQFQVTICNSFEAFDAVTKHSADFAFIEQPLVSRELERTLLQQDQLVLAGQADQNLWLIRESTSGVFHYTKAFLEENNISGPFMEINSNAVILQLLNRGIGRSIISQLAVEDFPYQILPEKYQRAFYLLRKKQATADFSDDCQKAILHWFELRRLGR